jgi:hypothetical protein
MEIFSLVGWGFGVGSGKRRELSGDFGSWELGTGELGFGIWEVSLGVEMVWSSGYREEMSYGRMKAQVGLFR